MSQDVVEIIGGIAAAVIVIAVIGVYLATLRTHLSTYAAAVDKPRQLLDAEGIWQKLKVASQGWRTVALAAAAAVSQLVPLLDYWLPQVQSMPWSSIVDQKTANIISLVCTILIPIVHAQGLAKAATTVPVDRD